MPSTNYTVCRVPGSQFPLMIVGFCQHIKCCEKNQVCQISLIHTKNSSESRTEPCGTPQVALVSEDICESNFNFNFKVYERYRFSISLFVSLA